MESEPKQVQKTSDKMCLRKRAACLCVKTNKHSKVS